mgnify:FL=1
MRKKKPNADIPTFDRIIKSRLAELNCRVTLTMDVLYLSELRRHLNYN